jgi:hypothetical protein
MLAQATQATVPVRMHCQAAYEGALFSTTKINVTPGKILCSKKIEWLYKKGENVVFFSQKVVISVSLLR